MVLDELDKELERRGHKFCRYADDCNIYVRSKEAGDRVYASIKNFIERTLCLTVNIGKSAVDFAWRRAFLGYSFLGMKRPRLRCSDGTIDRFKHNIRRLTRGHHRVAAMDRIQKLNSYIGGWFTYFRLATTRRKFLDLDGWIRSRLRMCTFKLWPRPGTRVREMIKLGLKPEEARVFSQGRRYWHLAQNHFARFAMNNDYWEKVVGYRGLEWNMKRFAN